MVQYLAKKLGLDECTGGQRKTFRLLKNRALRRRSLQDVEVNYKDNVPVVVGISAEPRNMPNYDAGESKKRGDVVFVSEKLGMQLVRLLACGSLVFIVDLTYLDKSHIPVPNFITPTPHVPHNPPTNTDCNEHYLGVPTKCYHMNGSLALYFRPDDLVQAEAENVLRLISRGMVEDRFQTTAIPIAVFTEGGVMGDNNSDNKDENENEKDEDSNTNDADKEVGDSSSNNNDGNNNNNSPTVPFVPEVDGAGVGGSIFAPSNPSIASANKDVTSNAAADGGSGGGDTSSATYAGIGAAIAAVALVVVVALFVRRRRRNLANKYSLREVGGGGHLEDSDEINEDGVVIVDKSKSHRKSNSHNFSDGTFGESPTLPNTPSSFDADDDGNYQEAVELGLTEEAAAATAAIAEAAAASAHRRTRSKDSQGSGFFTAAQSVQKSRSAGSNTTVGADNMAPIQQQIGGAAAGAEDDANSVASDESGVTIELDMNRVNSTVSEITWAGPQAQREAAAVGNILNRFPPYKSLYSGQNPGAIVEEDDDFDENDEDVIAGGSVSSQRSTGGGSTDFGPAPIQRLM